MVTSVEFTGRGYITLQTETLCEENIFVMLPSQIVPVHPLVCFFSFIQPCMRQGIFIVTV